MESIVYSNAVDEKWQKIWADSGLYRFDESKMDKKLYLLEMFSYPSGKNLHIGHWWNYSLSDSYGRLKRMQGHQVFHPPGFDAFGLPAENYAIHAGVHPADSTRANIRAMERQFRAMGTTYDWSREVVTCDPAYYRWTQWLFLKLFERGLAYRAEAPANWCDACKTVLANEQAAGGVCERCGAQVTRKRMTQWFFKITDYAEELLEGLPDLDWPEKTKRIQEHWIGKSVGCEIDFPTDKGPLRVFTTRPDTLMGATHLVLAPEHPLLAALTRPECQGAVADYQIEAARASEIERLSTAREKGGAFTGAFATHPLTGALLPVWIADYVLPSYGTGAVMAVPAHDERDFAFAQKHHLPVRQVIQGPGDEPLPLCGEGLLINSRAYDGLTCEAARAQITADLERKGLGRRATKYRLRDWLVSRQRYWGTPIPIVYCGECGMVPVPEAELPVRLPRDVAFLPSGQSPLALCEEFANTRCPRCGGPAKRDTDTLDTFVCSSWYYLRFLDPHADGAAFDPKRIERLMPVDRYVGGVEHAAMHLLYARFMTKALRDMGYLRFGEPIAALVHQGVILDADGRKMSKRSGAVSPDGIVQRHGVDVFRLHLCFGFSFLDGGPWSDEGIKAMARFVQRTCRVIERHLALRACPPDQGARQDEGLDGARERAILEVARDIENFQFNTAVARVMEFVNALSKYQMRANRDLEYEQGAARDLVVLLAPLAPHLSEELWQRLGCAYSVHNQPWPTWAREQPALREREIPVQVDGTLRGLVRASGPLSSEEALALALGDQRVLAAVHGRGIRRTIVVPGRLINLVCE